MYEMEFKMEFSKLFNVGTEHVCACKTYWIYWTLDPPDPDPDPTDTIVNIYFCNSSFLFLTLRNLLPSDAHYDVNNNMFDSNKREKMRTASQLENGNHTYSTRYIRRHLLGDNAVLT